jgi:hypothetical protein
MVGDELGRAGKVFFGRNANKSGGESRPNFASQLAVAVVLLSMGLQYAIFLAASLNLNRKVLEISIAGFHLMFVSAIVGWLLAETLACKRKDRLVPIVVWTAACSGVLAAAFIALAFFAHLYRLPLELWRFWAWRVLVATLVLHTSGILALARSRFLRSRLADFDFERVLSVALLLIFSSLALNFDVEPTNRWFNPLLQFVFAPSFNQAPAFAIISAIATVAVVLALARFEQGPASSDLRTIGLPVIMIAMAIFYFDFRLPADPMHYLTNASPALRLLHGGIPLVDTFSQYGPGPMIATSAAFAVLPATLGTASILVQCFNLLFFVVLLFSLSRLTSTPVASAVLGAAIISVLLGCWGSGYSNLAAAPSNMGFRYLWPAALVLAISLLPASRVSSGWTASAAAISALWSIEALAASVLILLSFVVAVRIAQRKPDLLLKDLPAAMLPAIIALSVLSLLIALWSGRWPDFGTYLQFLGVYNAFSDYWGILAANTFWGWIPVLIVLSLIASLVWKLLLVGTIDFGAKVDRDILYGYLPMALLAAFISLYYLGRSVDNVLLLALLPLSCLVVGPYLNATATWNGWGPVAWSGFGLITFSIVWGLSCGYIYLYRSNSPYHMAFHECRYDKHCSVSDLVSTLRRSIEKNEPEMGAISYIGANGEKMVNEAVSLIVANFKNERASVFLGTFQGRSLATDLALLRAGKSSRWPISYTFTDELLPQLAERIAAMPIELNDGEPVIIRRDETALGPLEREILRRLRDRIQLCVRETGFYAVVYTVSRNRECKSN